MKCMYYLAPTLVSTHQISDDLRDVGIDEWYVHVISEDEAGLKKEKLHSSNWLETRDLLRDGLIGANIGLIAGVIAAGAMMLFQPFGPDIPHVAYFFVIAVATLFGAWVGGLVGIETQNKKIKRFHDDIRAGQYLVLIYARKGMGERVKEMMRKRHPEARHVGTDSRLFNPFAAIERRRRGPEAGQLQE